MSKGDRDFKILVADDEPEVVDLVRMMLEWEGGFTVVGAADGEEALDRAADERPDLILLDVRMPKKSGMDVLEDLGLNPSLSSIPVVMLSVVTTYPEVQSALRQGAVAYLSKPFELREMVRLVERVLAADPAGRSSLRQQALESIGRP